MPEWNEEPELKPILIPPNGQTAHTILSRPVPHGVDVMIRMRSLTVIDAYAVVTHAILALFDLAEATGVNFDEAYTAALDRHDEEDYGQ